jgi:NAD(P)-dependent dehydrogenase (short-subunit alcohol dehydrogenase family)
MRRGDKDMADTRLANRVALVFGAGSSGPGWGNGKATAVAYARAGAKVACVDFDLPRAEETARLVRAEGGEATSAASASASTSCTTTSASACSAARWTCPKRTGTAAST